MTALPGGISGGIGSAGVDTRSFGESHASELSRVSSFSGMAHTDSPQPMTAAPVVAPAAAATAAAGAMGYSASSPTSAVAAPPAASSLSNVGGVVNPALLNNNPAPIPEPVSSSATVSSPSYVEPTSTISPSTFSNVATDGHSMVTSSVAPSAPTVAETGIPMTAGTGGPGPSTGSLNRDAKVPLDDSPPYSFAAPGAGATGPQSAEDEKRRLEREEREKLLSATTAASGPGVGVGQGSVGASTTSSAEQYPSAEDEKKRLEREEREKLLGTSSSTNNQGGSGPNPDQKDLTGPPSGPPPDYS